MVNRKRKNSEVSEVTKRFYSEALRKRDIIGIYQCLTDAKFSSQFKFLGEYFSECLATRSFDKLYLPVFDTQGMSYEHVLEHIFMCKPGRGIKKRVGLLIKEHGVQVINNIFILRQLKIYDNPDHLMNFRHEIWMNPDLLVKQIVYAKSFRLLRMVYSPDRLLNHIIMFVDQVFIDTLAMMDVMDDEEFIRIAPRKVRSILAIHNRIIPYSEARKEYIGRTFVQELAWLHREKLGEYVIEVPSSYDDLLQTTHDLKHCVATADYCSDILGGRTQIINLLKDGVRKYTLEIQKHDIFYSIEQFKGKYNDDAMEGIAGLELRRELLGKLNPRPVIKQYEDLDKLDEEMGIDFDSGPENVFRNLRRHVGDDTEED